MRIHSIKERCLAFETVRCTLADPVKEVIKGAAEHQNLKDLLKSVMLHWYKSGGGVGNIQNSYSTCFQY